MMDGAEPVTPEESQEANGNGSGTGLSAAGLPLAKNWLAVIAFIWIGQAVSMITSTQPSGSPR